MKKTWFILRIEWFYLLWLDPGEISLKQAMDSETSFRLPNSTKTFISE